MTLLMRVPQIHSRVVLPHRASKFKDLCKPRSGVEASKAILLLTHYNIRASITNTVYKPVLLPAWLCQPGGAISHRLVLIQTKPESPQTKAIKNHLPHAMYCVYTSNAANTYKE